MGRLNDKDIERIVGGLEGFKLGNNFNDENGLCCSDRAGERASLTEPHEPSDQIYRFIDDESGNSFGLVTREGDVRLSIKVRANRYFAADRVIRQISQKYCMLRHHLDQNKVGYIPDQDFEQAIKESAAAISGSRL